MCDKLPQEKLHLKFCIYTLGVSSRATNLAVRGETGRYPLLLQILTNMLKCLMHIKSSKNDLLTEAFRLSENLTSSGIDSWVNSMKSNLTYLKINADIKIILESFKSISFKIFFNSERKNKCQYE